MKEIFAQVWEDVQLYNNNTLFMILFVLALIWLMIAEKNRGVKIVLGYISIALIVIILNPIYAWIGLKIEQEAYYRVWWMLPIGVVVCYGAVKAVEYVKHLSSKVLIMILVIALMVVNGRFVYTNTIHFKASNKHHIPQMVIEVAEALKIEDYKPKAVLPAELLSFIRQYTADIYMPYGRNILEKQWGFTNPLYDCMEAEVYHADEIAKYARAEQCVYVVLSSIKPMQGTMEENHYTLQGLVSGYYIYRDDYCYEALKSQGILE